MAVQVWGRRAFRFGCSACYGASRASARRMQQLRAHARHMSEFFPIQDDVYGLTDDQKQVTHMDTVLLCNFYLTVMHFMCFFSDKLASYVGLS